MDEKSVLLGVFVVFVLLFGGGGTPAELAESITLLGSAALLAWVSVVRGWRDYGAWRIASADFLLAVPFVLLLIVYFLQLVPLPTPLWALLPGRSALLLNLQTYTDLPWLALSIAPQATMIAILSLLPPLVGYGLAVNSGRSGAVVFVGMLFVFGVATIALQLLQTTGSFFPFAQTQNDFTSGFQANRNAQGDVLMILMTVLAARQRAERSVSVYAQQQLTMAIGLLVAVIFTGSRAGMLITAVPFAWLCWNVAREAGFRVRTIMLTAAGLAAGGGALIAVLISNNAAFAKVVNRFTLGSDGRTNYIWPDSIYAAEQFWPLGAGVGTFMPAFQLFETQESIVNASANRAHNAALEVMIESGLPGMVLVGCLILAVFWRTSGELARAIDSAARRRAASLLMVSALLLLHSAVDYPMRSMSIASVWAVMLGLVIADRRRRLAIKGERGKIGGVS